MAAILLASVLAPAQMFARQRRVLVVTETAGFHHDSIAAATALLQDLGCRSRRYDVDVLAGVHELTAARLRRAGAVVFLNTSGELPLSTTDREQLLRFVRSGGGFVGTHSASDTFHQWPEYVGLLGAQFVAHPFVGEGRVIVEDRRHPATRRLPPSFMIREEFYFFDRDPRCCAHVLARLDVTSFGSMDAEDRPLIWCRREGRGRVFYDALGHFEETWADAHQRALLAGGLAWVLRLARHPQCRPEPLRP